MAQDISEARTSEGVQPLALEHEALPALPEVVAAVDRDLSPVDAGEHLYVATIIDAAPLEEAIQARDRALQQMFALGDGLVVFSPDWNVLEVSPRFCELTGFTADELVGATPPFPWWPADEYAAHQQLMVAAPGEIELLTRRKDGLTFPALVTKSMLPGDAGVLALVKDISSRRAEVDELRKRAGLFEAAHDAVILTDLQDRILDWNPAATQYYGFDRSEVVGVDRASLLQTIIPVPLADLHKVLFETGHWEGTLRNTTKNGDEVVLSGRQSLIFDANGEPCAILRVDIDMTERVRARAQLESTEQRFRLLATQAPVGFFEADLTGMCVWANEYWQTLTGTTIGAGWAGSVHPDDRSKVDAAWHRAIAHESPLAMDFRIVRPDGSVLWVAATAASLRSGQGEITGHLGTLKDITEEVRRRSEEATESELAMVAVRDAPLEELLPAIAIKAHELYGFPAVVLIRFDAPGVGTRVASHPDFGYLGDSISLSEGTAAGLVQVTGRSVSGMALKSDNAAIRRLNSMGLVRAAGVPVTVDGQLWGALCVASDEEAVVGPEVTEHLAKLARSASAAIAHVQHRQLLEQLASTDFLTGLANRRVFDDTLQSELLRATRYGRALAVILVDIDSLKRANDTAGHEVGDQLLKNVGARMSRTVRAGELVARIGGDEFGWILPEADASAAADAAARLLFAISAEPLERLGKITASAGIAVFVQGQDAAELVRRADAAMYKAKAEGGNTFWVAET